MVRFSPEPIDPANVYEQLVKEGSGSVLLHFAVARAMCSEKGITSAICFQPVGDVAAEMSAIASEMRDKWELTDLLLVRRQGTVTLGEIISLVGVSSPRSESAFEACRFGLDRLKKMSSIGKREIFG